MRSTVNYRWALVAVCLAGVCLLPALTYANGHTTPPKPTARPRATPVPVKTLRLAMPDASPLVDPALVADEENVQLADLLYSGLVRLDASYHVVPDAASSYRVSRDHRVYTFYLRHGLRFSNGDPLTASDFRYAITRSLNPLLKSPSAPTYLTDIQGATPVLEGKAKTVSGIKVINPYTLQITVRWSLPYFLMELTYPTSFALPRHHIAKYGAIDNTAWYASPAGSGPYRLKSWSPNNKIVLTANPYYYGPRPAVGKVTVSLGAFPATDVYSYVTHNLDVVSLPSYDGSLLHQPGVRETNSLAIDGVYMNLKAKPFDNLHVRRALTLALNRPKIVSSAMGETATPFAGFVPPGQAGYDSQLRTLSSDGATARHELQLAGYSTSKHFPPITLYYASDPTIARLASAVAKSWQQYLGITVDTRALILSNLLAKVQSPASLPLYISGWSADFPDPHDWLSSQWETGAVNNNVHYSNPAFDKASETADVTWKYSSRMALYNHAQQILVDDAAWIPLYIPHRLVYIRPTVSNLSLTGYGVIPEGGTWARVQMRSGVPNSKR